MMHSVFDESPVNDVVTRSTMIAEYAEKGNYLSSFSNAPEEDGIRLLHFSTSHISQHPENVLNWIIEKRSQLIACRKLLT